MIRIFTAALTGGRKFTDRAAIFRDVARLTQRGLAVLVHGANPEGADALAALIGNVQSRPVDIPAIAVVPYAVDEAIDGPWPNAGRARNLRMLDRAQPDFVFAYPDPESTGTWHCVQAALYKGISVCIYHAALGCREPPAGMHITASGALHIPETTSGPRVRSYFVAKRVHDGWSRAEYAERVEEYRQLLQ